MGIVRHLEAVVTYPELRAAHNAVEPLGAFYTIPLHPGLWRNIKAYAATEATARALTRTRHRFRQKTIDTFRRSSMPLAKPASRRST